MPIYASSSALEKNMKQLFDQIASEGDAAAEAVSKSRLIMGLTMYDPELQITVNGRVKPVEITYGPTRLRPDLGITISADALHYIMLGELSLKKALIKGQVRVRGPVHKSFVLEGVFRRGQELYPHIWQGES
jgi:hypothetical protein